MRRPTTIFARRFGPSFDRPQPHRPDDRAAGVDDPPVRSEEATGPGVGGEHARLCREPRSRRTERLQPKVHHRDAKAGRMYPRERCGGDLGRRSRPRALRCSHEGSQDDLARRVIGQEVETTLESDVAERLVARRVENALRPGPSEASNPRQGSKQRDLVCRDGTNRLVRPIRRRFDRRLVKLAELADGNDLVKSADG